MVAPKGWVTLDPVQRCWRRERFGTLPGWSRWTGALHGRYCVLASVALLADISEIPARRINASRLQRG
ncbi:hypothetical protein GCM10009587_09400 [Microbacterium maritypicum]